MGKGDGVSDDTQAIQAALNDAGTGGRGDVVYLPAGTYKITSNIHWVDKINVSLLGHSPSDTIIKWAGPAAGCPTDQYGRPICSTMLWVDGVNEARFGRITWDGQGTASIAVWHDWDASIPNQPVCCPTNLSHEDEVFKNVQKGLVAGGPRPAGTTKTSPSSAARSRTARLRASVRNRRTRWRT